jgi:hypothetical protein
MMRKSMFLPIMFFVILFSAMIKGCVSQANDKTVSDLVATVDSLNRLLVKDTLAIDSLKMFADYEKIMARRTAGKCHDYAVIVKKNPTQSVFIVNWIDRAFQWTQTKKVSP